MKFINDIANIFLNADLISCSDNLLLCTSKYRLTSELINEDYISNFKLFSENVASNHLAVNVEFQFKHQEFISFDASIQPNIIKDKLEELLSYFDASEENILCIEIFKEQSIKKNNTSHIFNATDFFSEIAKITDIELLEHFKLFNTENQIHFKSWDTITPFSTSNISFFNSSGTPDSSTLINRLPLIDKRNKSCHFTNDSEYKFTPDDFYIQTDCIYPEIKEKFDTLLSLHLIIYLCDYSELTKKQDGCYIEYKMKGYRLINQQIKSSTIDKSGNEELFRIYNWVYNQGNFVDKIGLARNVLSIHMTGDNITSITKGTLKSIESSYDIYLKENVKQYIDIKNKISEFLISQSDKASEITKNMFTTFKTSFWSVITFFLSVFLIKIITSNSYKGTVTIETLLVTLLFIVMSFVYLYITNKEVNEEKERLLTRYETVKNRYKDLLNEDDLNNIIDTQKLKKDDETYINTRQKRYTITWVIFNLAICSIVVILFFATRGSNTNAALSEIKPAPVATAPVATVSNTAAPAPKLSPTKPNN